MIPNKLILLLVSALAWMGLAQAEGSVYRWQAEDGTVHFADEPPPNSVEGVKELALPQAEQGGPEVRSRPVPSKVQGDGLASQRMAQRRELNQQLDKLERELKSARQAYETGEVPLEGERQGIAGGRTKLGEAYFKRREGEANEIKRLEKQISEVRKQLLQLR